MKINPEAQLAVKLYMNHPELGDRSGAKYSSAALSKSESESVHDAAKLCSMARALHRLDEAACNGDLTERQFKRRVNLGVAIRKIAESYGLRADHNADPRGYSVYLHFPDGSYNSWGGKETGWGI